MKHLLNNLSEEERDSIRGQYTGRLNVVTENFKKFVSKKLGDVSPIVENSQMETKKETKESFWNMNFGKPSVKDAAHTHLKKHGYSEIGKDENDDENYIVYKGEKFYPNQIEYADYQDMGDLPRVEDGKLVIANPGWKL